MHYHAITQCCLATSSCLPLYCSLPIQLHRGGVFLSSHPCNSPYHIKSHHTSLCNPHHQGLRLASTRIPRGSQRSSILNSPFTPDLTKSASLTHSPHHTAGRESLPSRQRRQSSEPTQREHHTRPRRASSPLPSAPPDAPHRRRLFIDVVPETGVGDAATDWGHNPCVVSAEQIY